VAVTIEEKQAAIVNGKIKAVVSAAGKLTIYNNVMNKLLLEEYARNCSDLLDAKCSSLAIDAREFVAIPSGNYKLIARFELQDRNEKIFGMG
jgi:alpha-D-xyloside xylohydrolase